MDNSYNFDNFRIFKDWDKEASERVKAVLKKLGLSHKTIADIIEMPLPTFNDKIAGKTSFKLGELGQICFLCGVNSDEVIFGKTNFVKEYYEKHDARDKIKGILTDHKAYETLGKLTAGGFFDPVNSGFVIHDDGTVVYESKPIKKSINKIKKETK